MKIIPSLFSRYLARHFIFSFIATLMVLMGFILLFDVIELLRRSASRNYVTFGDILQLGLLKLPQMIPLLLPFAVLIAALIVLYRLSKNNELVIARAAGLSNWNFLFPIIAVVFAIGLINVTLFNPISAAMYKKYQLEEKTIFKKNANLAWTDKGLWLREKQDEHVFVMYAQHVKHMESTLFLTDVILLELGENETLVRQLEAPKGTLRSNLLVLLSPVSYEGEDKREQLPFFSLPTEFDIDRILQTFDVPEEISFWQLPEFIEMLDSAGFSTARYKMHFYGLLASVFYLISMALIASVFGMNPNQRQGGILIKICGAFLFGFILFFLSRLTTALGVSGSLPFFLAAFGPSIVAVLLALTILLYQENG